MKKILMLLAALIAVTFFSQEVYGAEKAAQVYISKSTRNKIESNLYNDLPVYSAMFGTEDIYFDFNKAVPV